MDGDSRATGAPAARGPADATPSGGVQQVHVGTVTTADADSGAGVVRGWQLGEEQIAALVQWMHQQFGAPFVEAVAEDFYRIADTLADPALGLVPLEDPPVVPHV